jgi:uncharacterized metal-binding protein YceD (DUF177 family)
MKDDFIVPLNGLTQERKAFRSSVGKEFFASFGNSEILDADLTVEVEDWKSAGSIFVDCSISGKATVTCDRCGDPLVLPVETGFALEVRFGDEGPERGIQEDNGREVVFLPESETSFDLSQAVYDYACLSLPVHKVHEDGGCNPEAVKYLSSGDGEKDSDKEQALNPFAGLKEMLDVKK